MSTWIKFLETSEKHSWIWPWLKSRKARFVLEKWNVNVVIPQQQLFAGQEPQMTLLSLSCALFRAGMWCDAEGRRGSCGHAGGSGQPGAGDPRHDAAPCKGGGHHPSQEEGQLHPAREGGSALLKWPLKGRWIDCLEDKKMALRHSNVCF